MIAMPLQAADTKLTAAQNISPVFEYSCRTAEKGIPRAYREFLKARQATLAALTLNPQTQTEELMGKLDGTKLIKTMSNLVKYGTAIIGIGKEVAGENYDKAAYKATVFSITELSGTEAGKALLKTLGISSSISVAIIVTALDVTYDAVEEANKWTNEKELESMNGGIEAMFPVKTGDKEKLPVTPANVEKVWQRVVTDRDFRAQFQIYVTERLQKRWPVPSLDLMTDPDEHKILSLAEKEKLIRSMLLESQNELKPYVAGILGALNKKAKDERTAAEARGIASKRLKELADKLKNYDQASIDANARILQEALKRFPKAKAFADTLSDEIGKAITNNDDSTLDGLLYIMNNYINDCLVLLPDDGDIGEAKHAVMEKFRAYYDFASEMRDRIKLIKRLTASASGSGGSGNSASVDFGDMYDLANQAWDDLEGNKINGQKYQETVNLAESGAGIKADKVLQPFRKDVADAEAAYETAKQTQLKLLEPINALITQENKDSHNWGWSDLGCWRLETEGTRRYQRWSDDYNAMTTMWRAEIDRLTSELNTANKVVWDECDKFYKTIESQKNDRYKMEGEALVSFLQTLKAWEDTPIDFWFNNYMGGFEKKTYPLGALGYAGTSLAACVFQSASSYTQDLLNTMNYSLDGSIVGVKNRYDARLADLQKTATAITDALSSIKSTDNTAAGLASGAPAMATVLGPKIEVWRYAWAYPAAVDMETSMSFETGETFSRLNSYQDTYLSLRESYLQPLSDTGATCQSIIDKATKIAAALAKEKSAVDAAMNTLDGLKRASSGLRTTLDSAGTTQMSTLSANGISAKRIQELEKLIADFASEEKLYAYALTISPGEKTYNPTVKPIWPLEVITQMRKDIKIRMATVATNRDAYEQAYKDFTTASKSLDAILQSMQEGVADSFPSVPPMLERSNVLTTVQQQFFKDSFNDFNYLNFYPPNPADFADPNYGVMARLDQYEQLAKKYHDLVDPELTKIIRLHHKETELLNDMADKVEHDGPAWMALGDQAFTDQCNTISHTAWVIINPLSSAGEAGRESPVLTAYNRVVVGIMKISDKYYAAQKLKSLIDDLTAKTSGVQHFLASPETNGGVATAKQSITDLQPYADPTSTAMKLKASDATLSGLLDQVKLQIAQLQKFVDTDATKKLAAITGDVKAFYDQFKRAYESKNDSKLMSYISDKWNSNDGTSLDDLQDHLQQSFKVFDEIHFTFSGLKVEPVDQMRYKVSYDLVITGRIYKNNIKHEEKSSVSEELGYNDKGKLLIFRNLDGRFWSVE